MKMSLLPLLLFFEIPSKVALPAKMPATNISPEERSIVMLRPSSSLEPPAILAQLAKPEDLSYLAIKTSLLPIRALVIEPNFIVPLALPVTIISFEVSVITPQARSPFELPAFFAQDNEPEELYLATNASLLPPSVLNVVFPPNTALLLISPTTTILSPSVVIPSPLSSVGPPALSAQDNEPEELYLAIKISRPPLLFKVF